jgi:hypothetical protein
MDCLSETAVRTGRRGAARRGIALVALLLTLVSGCVSTDQLVTDLVGNPPSTVTQVVAFWGNQLMPGVDPVHNGAPLYGIAGRVYLFGPGLGENLVADGKIIVEMYGMLPEQPQGPPGLLETWEIKKDILNGVCLKRDGFGTGYTLNLPWEHYRPDVTHLDIRVRYEPNRGMTIYTRSLVALAGGSVPEVIASKRTETGDGRVLTAAMTGTPPAPPQPPGLVTPPALPPQAPPRAGAMPGVVAPPPFSAAPPPQAGAAPAAFPVPPQQAAPMPAQGAVQQVQYQAPVQSPYHGQPQTGAVAPPTPAQLAGATAPAFPVPPAQYQAPMPPGAAPPVQYQLPAQWPNPAQPAAVGGPR